MILEDVKSKNMVLVSGKGHFGVSTHGRKHHMETEYVS
jgi:hypothetical protein